MTDKRLLTPAEVAERLQVTLRTVQRWIADGLIPSYKLGKTRRISEEQLNKFLALNAEERKLEPKEFYDLCVREFFGRKRKCLGCGKEGEVGEGWIMILEMPSRENWEYPGFVCCWECAKRFAREKQEGEKD